MTETVTPNCIRSTLELEHSECNSELRFNDYLQLPFFKNSIFRFNPLNFVLFTADFLSSF